MTNDLVERLRYAMRNIAFEAHRENALHVMSTAVLALEAANALAETLRLYVENEKMIHRKEAAGLLEAYRVALGGEG